MKSAWYKELAFACSLAALVMIGMSGGCIVHGHGGYAQVDLVDVHGYHHQGYYDEHHDWHGGYYDEQHQYHNDAHDWHQ
jgi:hypothetical protein